MLSLPLSKSSWPEGRFGRKEYQDYYRIVKIAINFLNENKIDKILLLSDFKGKKANKSELENMIDICRENNISNDKLYIEKYGYDTLSQIKFTLDLCDKEKQSLLIISSITHYPRVRWIAYRVNKKYSVNIKHKIGWGIPRVHDVVYDIPLMFIYPIIDLLGFSNQFSKTIKNRRDSGRL